MSTGQVDIQNSERVARETASEVQVGKVGVGAIAFESVQTAIKHDVLGLAAEIAYRSALALVPFLLKGVASDPALNLSDAIHPNAIGQRILADNVWAFLEPLLRKGP